LIVTIVDDGLPGTPALSSKPIVAGSPCRQPNAIVHLFTRSNSRSPFTYHGPVKAISSVEGPPVEVVWKLPLGLPEFQFPEEVKGAGNVFEGARRKIEVNAYERDRNSRATCIAHWGAQCSVCAMRFPERYSGLGDGYIHVHHLKPLASIGREYELDPIKDLRPVCPNCHAVLHFTTPPMSIEVARSLLK
jgi:5-methylcytosine-specific restriction enzyme A